MEELFFNFIDQFGYFAVGALIFIENIFPPIPSELILPLGGFFTTTTDMVLPGVIIAATAGSVLGAYILYGIGYMLNRDRLMRFFETKPMRLLGFKGDDIAKAIDWFDRRGQISVLICSMGTPMATPALFTRIWMGCPDSAARRTTSFTSSSWLMSILTRVSCDSYSVSQAGTCRSPAMTE